MTSYFGTTTTNNSNENENNNYDRQISRVFVLLNTKSQAILRVDI